ncbi:MAG: thiamine pyrophosphate-dependent dehydrogenase E1 component subunit alpha [Acidobacteria bacterium]|nr:MAG: thiamine pyrophosphate-dependent dehydrogenase E1 component subunit alpha [Acidobacteriota bacterium]REJ99002.1 MAG: thiamine pyrophosphate-dependent dehydrogenase E1 component subunit alpha [Acidobacteriota bacterium]REK16278.1 MAG: thiamine pyrophosphate-dependent dehydrogenase E1 component subunit alpha [Acidobacteriota bacterium]REK43959.1 MAG: thiamine pyrophosphate-dependent dehydrogenase E1 component subunit alpha [Acidobacteriota bacterium]
MEAPKKPLSCTGNTALTDEQLVELYRFLKITRMFDEKTVRLKKQSKLTGGVFTSLGQEATAVGTAYALEPQDFIAPLIRDIGACFVKRIEPREIFLQYFGRGTAASRATDVQFHFADIEKGFVGPISHLGDMIPVMAGILLASRMRGENRVAAAYLGEGATSTGTFHEGVNFAAVRKLPLITIVENNGYAYSTPTNMQCAADSFVDKALGYGIKGLKVDGNDVVACYEVMKEAVEHAREGKGSVLIEAMTYRRKGHAEHDNQAYVPEGEIEWWAEHNDPIKRFELFLENRSVLSGKEMDAIADDIKDFLDREADAAESEPLPEPQSAGREVFDNSVVPPAVRKDVLKR